MSSSVVVTGSLITLQSLSARLFLSGAMVGMSVMFGPYTSCAEESALPKPLYTLDVYAFSSYSNGAKFSSKSKSKAEVNTPPFAAVAAIERASIRATEEI